MIKSYLTLKLSSWPCGPVMTSNHQNNTIDGFSSENPMRKRYRTVLHLFLALFVKSHVSLTWPRNGHLKTIFDMKKVSWMDYSIKIASKRCITLIFICWKLSVFYFFDLGIELLTLRMILNHQNYTINRFSSRNPMKNRYYTFSLLYLLKILFLLQIWHWNWIIKMIKEMDFSVKITPKRGITLFPTFIS